MNRESLGKRRASNQALLAWVEDQIKLCDPDGVFWCDGSEQERDFLTAEAVARGVLIRLDQKKLPGCYYHRSNPNDVARVEQCTYICGKRGDEAGSHEQLALRRRRCIRKLEGLRAAGGCADARCMWFPYPCGACLDRL